MSESGEPGRTALDLDYRLVLDRFVDAVVAADDRGRIVYANPAAERLLGWPAAELIGLPLATIQPPRLREAHVAGFARYRSTGVPHLIGGRARVPALRRDGTEVDVELALSAVRVGDAEIFVASLRDLGEWVDVEREQAARAEAEAAQRRSAILAEASAALAPAVDEATVLATVARVVVPALADACVFDLIAADGTTRRAVFTHPDGAPGAATGEDPARPDWVRELEDRYPIDLQADDNVVVAVLRSVEPSLAPEVPDHVLAASARDARHLELLRALGIRSHMIVPLVARDRTLGAITFVAAASGRRYGLVDLALAGEVARRAALAIDNARLLAQTRAAEEQSRRQAARLAVLAEASQAFAAARLDLPAVLDTVARQTVAALGDGCIIRLVSADGASFVPAAAHYPNAEALAFLWGLLRSTPHPVGEGLVGRVFTTGAPVLLAAPTPVEMGAALKPEYRAFQDRFGLHSALIVPLRGQDGVIGTLMTWRDAPGRPYTPDDQGFLEALADRAASAIEHARLYREQVEARARVQELAAERAMTLGQIADGVIIADAAGAITFVNEAAHRLHGVAELGVGVEGYTATYHLLTMEGEPYPPTELPLARAVVRGETVVDAEWRIRRPDGTEIVAQGSAAPVAAEDGTRVGAVLTLRDVTAQRAFQRQKDEFFVTASHDLKTPLTSIKGWAQVLRQRAMRSGSPTRDRDVQALAAIEAQANGMQRLLEQLLDASRLQLGQRLELARTEIDLAELATRLVVQYRALTDRHEFRGLARGPGTVRGRWDEGRLEQIVANLLSNAVKYSPAGGPVDVVVERVAGEARLAVRDEGIGIPAAERERVFEQFYRAENVAGDPETLRGLGLGLFSAQRLAGLHGGRIEVESELGRGSTFTLVLPLDGTTVV